MIRDLAWLGLAGAAGTLSRYGLSGLTQRLCGAGFPWGTLAVNVLGCFLFGFVWTLAEDRLVIGGHTRFLVLTGFMGAFTTFSTYAYETGAMLRDSDWKIAATNVAAHNLLGLAAVFLGFAAGRNL